MPQEFQVLCCYKCEMFQVHHMKKAKKWQCKICNEKQSFKRVYIISSAPDCRSLCQELNMRKAGVKFNDKTDGEEEADNTLRNDQNSFDVQDAAGINRFGDQSYPESEGEDTFEESRNVLSDDVSLLSRATVKNSNKTMACFQEEIVQSTESSEFNWDISFKESDIFAEDIANVPDLKISKESHKRPLEIKADDSSRSLVMPPVKKNRGFQMIKNMKNFQRENAQPTETSEPNWDIGFKQSDAIAENAANEAVDLKCSKESYQCPFDIKADVPFQSLVIQPKKKNRGFQMIKNAASKLS